MPTIKQLPAATSVSATDVLPVSQGGTTKALTVGGLLSSTQAAISLTSGKLLGRASSVAGGPEPVALGSGLSISSGAISATGSDHASLPVSAGLVSGDEVVVNSGGAPKRMPAPMLRALFTAGSGVSIDAGGTISATSASASLAPASPTSLGGVRVGAGLAVSGDGTLSAQVALTNGALAVTTAAPGTSTTQAASTAFVAGAIARSASDVNVAAFGAVGDGSQDCTAAFNAAWAASNGVVAVPAGNWVLNSPLSWTGKAATLRGAGKGVTTIYVKHAGIGLTIAQSSLFDTVNISGITFRAAHSSASTAALSLSWPDILSFAGATATISDCEFDGALSAPSPGYPNTFTDGVRMSGGWQVHFTRVSGFGAPDIGGFGARSGTSLARLSKCFGITFDGCKVYNFDSVVRQSDYCEGIAFLSLDSVGCNTTLVQDSGINLRAGFALIGLWVTNCEINNYISGFDVKFVRGGQMAANHFSRWGDSGSLGYLCLKYTDSDGVVHSANVLGGGGSDSPVFATAKAIVLAGSTNGMVFDSSNLILNCAVGATMGSATFFNVIYGVLAKDVSPDSSFTNLGANNRMSWVAATGSNYPLDASVIGAALPAMNGVAAAGSSVSLSRQDHVHPTDTSRYAASNPAGYQTAAQVSAAVANLVNGAPAAFDTLGEIAAALAADESAAATLATTVGGKLAKASNLSDLASASAARTNLGLATVAASGAYADLSGVPAIPAAGSAAPLVNGAATAGSSAVYARADHVHPTDTSRAAIPFGAVMTSGASVAMTAAVLIVRRASPGATAVTLPASPVAWSIHVVKDGLGDAATNPITITPSSGTIEGAANFVLNVNRGAVSAVFDGANWSIV